MGSNFFVAVGYQNLMLKCLVNCLMDFQKKHSCMVWVGVIFHDPYLIH